MPFGLDRLLGSLYRPPRRRSTAGGPTPALERRAPQRAAEDYAARHLIEHTLDRKANLRRLAPGSPEAAQRYHQLLGYELDALHDMVRVLRSAIGGPDLVEFLGETAAEIDRLQIEVAWCERLLATDGH